MYKSVRNIRYTCVPLCMYGKYTCSYIFLAHVCMCIYMYVTYTCTQACASHVCVGVAGVAHSLMAIVSRKCFACRLKSISEVSMNGTLRSVTKLYSRLHTRMHIEACVYVYLHTHTPILTYLYTHTRTLTYKHTHLHKHIGACVPNSVLYTYTQTYMTANLSVQLHTVSRNDQHIVLLDVVINDPYYISISLAHLSLDSPRHPSFHITVPHLHSHPRLSSPLCHHQTYYHHLPIAHHAQ